MGVSWRRAARAKSFRFSELGEGDVGTWKKYSVIRIRPSLLISSSSQEGFEERRTCLGLCRIFVTELLRVRWEFGAWLLSFMGGLVEGISEWWDELTPGLEG